MPHGFDAIELAGGSGSFLQPPHRLVQETRREGVGEGPQALAVLPRRRPSSSSRIRSSLFRSRVTVGVTARLPIHPRNFASSSSRISSARGISRPALAVLLGDALEIVQAVHERVVDVAHRRLDVGGDGEIQEEHGAAPALVHRVFDVVAADHGPRARRRSDDDVRLGELAEAVLPRHGSP